MDSIYENSSFILSPVTSGETCSQHKDNFTEEQDGEREVCPPKWTKILLIVFAVSLVFSIGSLCILGILYFSLSVKLSAQETKNTLMAREFQELAVNYTRVREDLHTKDNMVREITDNYIRVREHLRTKGAMERELEKLTANYTRVREQLSLYEAFVAQSCNMSMTDWGGKLYFFISDKLNWSSSRDVCVSNGADLVTITSQSEQEFLVSNVEETHWIGLSDLDTEGHWVWVNNQTLTDTGVQFWYRSEPDNWKQGDPSGENCACLGNWVGYLNKWFDHSCKEQKKFICEKNLPFSLTD